MKKSVRVSRLVMVILAVVLACSCLVISGGALTSNISNLSLGEYLKIARNETNDYVVAYYRDNKVTQNEINYFRNTNPEMALSMSDKDIANKLIKGFVLVDVAEKNGLAATPSEIEELINTEKQIYSSSEGKIIMDEYFEAAGISYDEYIEIISSQAYGTISRQKLRNSFMESYCQKNGFDLSNMTTEMSELIEKAYNQYENNMFKQCEDDVVYEHFDIFGNIK